MTLAKAAVMVTAEARAWWWQHWQWQQRWAVGHHPVFVIDGGGKDVITAAAIDRRCIWR